MTVKDLRSSIAAAVVVVWLFAVGGWVFAQDKPAAPSAAADTICFDFYYLFF